MTAESSGGNSVRQTVKVERDRQTESAAHSVTHTSTYLNQKFRIKIAIARAPAVVTTRREVMVTDGGS